MEFSYAEIHAFPDGPKPHSGNPAGVVLLHRDLSDADLLGIAQSNNLSETAYLKPMGEKDQWSLRWFTPGLEVELCGHATLASAAWLFETGRVVGPEARFHTLHHVGSFFYIGGIHVDKQCNYCQAWVS